MADLDEDDLRFIIDTQLQIAGLDTDGPPFVGNGDGEYWPVARELRDRLVTAIMADFGPKHRMRGSSAWP